MKDFIYVYVIIIIVRMSLLLLLIIMNIIMFTQSLQHHIYAILKYFHKYYYPNIIKLTEGDYLLFFPLGKGK